jgi:hypothetical protein
MSGPAACEVALVRNLKAAKGLRSHCAGISAAQIDDVIE